MVCVCVHIVVCVFLCVLVIVSVHACVCVCMQLCVCLIACVCVCMQLCVCLIAVGLFLQIDGCHRFSINSSEILSTGRHFYGRRFSIDASVREMATGRCMHYSSPHTLVWERTIFDIIIA